MKRSQLLALALVGSPTSALAQFNSVPSIMMPVIVNVCPAGRCPAVTAANRPERGGTAVSIDTSYQPTPALARDTVDGYVARLRKDNPQASAALAKQFRERDYGSIYRGIAGPFGLSDSDTAGAMTAYTVLGWMIATGTSEPSRAAIRAARQQIGMRMTSNPKLTAPMARVKLGEEFKLLFVTLHAGWQSAQNDGTQGQYSEGVAVLFQRQGTDLRALRLTERGFAGR